ncbi:TPA: hypothetical protein ACK2W2_005670 [Klebsiella michiganensis]|nr:hypothetical protein [Citrobacter freundii]QLO06783.1 hypothetical protein HV141_25245 [Citrobacter freundii]
MRKMILNTIVCLFSINASSFAISADNSPSRDELNAVMKVHASEVAAVIACKDYLENGEERLAEAKSKAGRVLGKMVGNQAKGSEYASRILDTVNEAKPNEQLKAEFDKVNLDNSVRIAKCAQLVAGNAARADDADTKYLN